MIIDRADFIAWRLTTLSRFGGNPVRVCVCACACIHICVHVNVEFEFACFIRLG